MKATTLCFQLLIAISLGLLCVVGSEETVETSIHQQHRHQLNPTSGSNNAFLRRSDDASHPRELDEIQHQQDISDQSFLNSIYDQQRHLQGEEEEGSLFPDFLPMTVWIVIIVVAVVCLGGLACCCCCAEILCCGICDICD